MQRVRDGAMSPAAANAAAKRLVTDCFGSPKGLLIHSCFLSCFVHLICACVDRLSIFTHFLIILQFLIIFFFSCMKYTISMTNVQDVDFKLIVTVYLIKYLAAVFAMEYHRVPDYGVLRSFLRQGALPCVSCGWQW